MVEIEETGKICPSWEETIYWTHFKCVHFFLFLRAGFDQLLAIPEKFVQNLKKKIPKTVSLKGPSGKIWNVQLTTSDSTMIFNDGWNAFVKDHSLEENDFLIFKYNGQSHFDVLMFNGMSMCEKETSYFVRGCEHIKEASGCLMKTITGANSVKGIQESSANGVECTSLEKTMDADDDVRVPSGRCSVAGRKRVRRAAQIRTVSSLHSKKKARPVAEHTSISTQGHQYLSSRRPITEEEKENALHLAQAASTDESFIAVMRATNVYKKYYLGISIAWILKHLPLQSHDVILHIETRSWETKFNYFKPRRFGGLLSGWKKFALDNNLEEFDVCLFEPASKSESSTTLDVTIFRVVEEVIPLTRVTSPRKDLKKGGKGGTQNSTLPSICK